MTSKDNIPVNTRHPAGAKTITWRGYTKIGRAGIISAYGATDIKKVGRFGFEQTIKVHSIGSGASWTRQEVRESQMAGSCLDRELALQIGDENARTIDQLNYLGDTAHGINGILNYPASLPPRSRQTAPDPRRHGAPRPAPRSSVTVPPD